MEGGERESFMDILSREKGARVEQHPSGRKKSQHFRVVSWKVQEVGETVCELFYSRLHHPGLITASLLALSFLADGGPLTL